MTDKLKALPNRRSDCPLACALDILGDKWTLVVIRDLFLGKSRYNAFLGSPEGITTNILAGRLKQLERRGLIEKHPYQQNPRRYEYRLTRTGKDLYPVMREMIAWSRRHVPGTKLPPDAGRSRR